MISASRVGPSCVDPERRPGTGNVQSMVGREFGRATAKVAQAAKPSNVMRRATDFARTLKAQYRAGLADDSDAAADARSVADAMRSIDWRAVKQTTKDTTAAVREMAAQVDWAKVQPVAAEVSSALIAAIASGELKLGGK
ncbi:MAG: hypothetical protein WCI22_18580, partial [Actinomycetota bacterium]